MPSKHHPCRHETEAGNFTEKNYDRERRFFTTPASYQNGKSLPWLVTALANHHPCKPSPLQVALAASELRQGAAIRSEICEASTKAVSTAGTLMNLKN